jgi:predicted nucleic acid-binding protein
VDEPLTFVDTNVWVYAYDPQEPEKRATAISYLENLAFPVISAQVMNEFHAVATRKLKLMLDDEAIRGILENMASLQVTAINADVVLDAQRLRVAHIISPLRGLRVATRSQRKTSRPGARSRG